MPTTALPEITLTCSAGHPVRTRARGGQAVKCPACRVSVWVPAGRPVDDSAAASSGVSPMAARWSAEAEPEDSELYSPSGIPCPECGSDQRWEPGRTLLLCLTCKGPSLPPSIGEHYRRAELAVRRTTDVDRAEQLRTEVRKRMEFAQSRDKAVRAVNSWLWVVDPDTLPERSGMAELAAELHGNLRHIARELEQAKNREEFAAAGEVAAELISVVKSYRDQFDNERDRAEPEEEEEEDEEEEYEDAEYEEEEDEEPAPYQPPEPAAWLQDYARRQIRPGSLNGRMLPNPYRTPPVVVQPVRTNPYINPTLSSQIIKYMEEKRETAKWCAFGHFRKAPAEFEYYGATYPGGPFIQGAPVVLCCAKHRDNAANWIEAHGYPNQTYSALESQ